MRAAGVGLAGADMPALMVALDRGVTLDLFLGPDLRLCLIPLRPGPDAPSTVDLNPETLTDESGDSVRRVTHANRYDPEIEVSDETIGVRTLGVHKRADVEQLRVRSCASDARICLLYTSPSPRD